MGRLAFDGLRRSGRWSTVAKVGVGALVALCLAILVLFAGPGNLLAQSGGGGGAQSLPVVPSIKIRKGTLFATSTSYGSGTTSTNGLCAAFPTNTEICTTERAPELTELARALRGDPNLIYEYVRNHVDTEFQYGLQKGALGALIDASGTPFDQAHLLVEVLRAAGHTARYKSGTITLNAAQFTDWTGISDAKAACDFLANGGIPASSAAGCSAGTPVGNVTLAHVWVEADVNGGTYLFDPSYKDYDHIAGIDVKAAMQFTSGQALSSATSGMGSGTQGGYAFVSGLNAGALNTKLETWSENLREKIGDDHQSAGMAEIVGGRIIEPAVRPVGGWKQTALPYTSAASLTWTGNIPDQYRTTLTVSAVMPGTAHPTPPTVFPATVFYVDEIYGRRLQVASVRSPNPVPWCNCQGYQPYLYKAALILDGVKLLESSTDAFNPGTIPAELTLAVNHPWGGPTGTFGDDTAIKRVDPMLPATIVHGWGSTSRGLASKWEREQGVDRTIPFTLFHVTPYSAMPTPIASGDLVRARMGANWLAQFTRSADIHAELANGRATHHHTVGVVSALINYTSPPDAQPWEGDVEFQPQLGFSMADETSIIDVETSFSLVTRDSHAGRRKAATFAIAATAASLEGSVAAELVDSPDVVSTARRLAWGNSPETGESPSTAGRRVYTFPSGGSGASGVVVFENLATGLHGSGSTGGAITANTANQFKNRLSNTVDSYTLNGFTVVASNEALLGPGHRHGSEYPYWIDSTDPMQVQTYFKRHPTTQAGGALVATKYDGSGDPEQIAHVLTRNGQIFKGGGGSSVTEAAKYDPKTAGDVMKDRFVDRTSAVGVDPMTGSAGFTSPVLDSQGPGEFPYRLERKIELRGGTVRVAAHTVDGPPTDQDGVVWNWDASAEVSSSTLEAMGASRPDAAAETIAAFVALQDLYTYSGTAPVTAERELTVALTANWWGRRLVANVITLMQGGASEQYLRMSDGAWLPSAGGAARLEVTGTRVAVRGSLLIDGPPDPHQTQFEAVTRTWNAEPMTIRAIGANGDQRIYDYWQRPTFKGDSESKFFGFRLAEWRFPQGVTITFNYSTEPAAQMTPTSVSNNLGQTLTLPALTEAPCLIANDDNGFGPAAIQGTIPAVTATDAGGAVTRAVFRGPTGRSTTQRPDERCVVKEIFTPGNTDDPSIRYTFDTLGRVKTAEDAEAVQGNRDPHQFFSADGYRGEREDPLGGRYAIESLRAGRLTRHIDELGYVTASAMDGRGRMIERTYPEGDKAKFVYDARNNPVTLTKCAKTGCDPAEDIVVQATWDAKWNKPATITDPLGRVTTFTYWDEILPGVFGDGASLIKTAVRPAPSGGPSQPTYSYWYNAKGLPTKTTDPDGIEVESTYSTAGCLTGTRLGPSALGLWKYFACSTKGDTTEAWDARGESLTKVTTTYDAMRRPTQVSAPLGAVTKTDYDEEGRPTLVQKRLYVGGVEIWQQWRTGYTATGQKLWVKDPQNDLTLFGYDALDRKVAETAPTGDKSAFVYDLAGQLLQIRKAVGISCVGQPAGFPCEQAEQTFTYSPNGQKTSLTDARNNTTTFVFDVHDRQLRTVFPDGTWEGSATYDKAGNVLKFRTREGTFLARAFDNLDRRTTETGLWTDGTTVANTLQDWRMRTGSFSYTLAGRMLSASTDQVSKAWTYDTAGRPATHSATMAAWGSPAPPTTTAQSFIYGWDVAGNMTSLTYPGNLVATYSYDALNRMTGVTTTGAVGASAALAYDTLSRRTSVTYGGNSSQTYAYELDDDLSSISHTFPSETAANVSFSWTYDAMGRQVSETISNALYQYEPPAEATAYGAATSLNQYPTVAGFSYLYDRTGDGLDPAGPLLRDGVRDYYYDERRNLTKVALISNAASTDVDWFDGLGVRVYSRRNDPAAADAHRMELNDGLRPEVVWEEIYSTPNGGSPTVVGKRYYVLGPNPDERLIYIDATVTPLARYLHANKRGDTVAISRSGIEDRKYKYGPFGESADSTAGYPFRFTGQRLNAWTGLYHFKARAYSPTLGRFLQPDPIGYEAGPNLYAYVSNNPIGLRDPTGLDPRICALTGETCDSMPRTGPGLYTVGGSFQAARFLGVKGTSYEIGVGLYWAVDRNENVTDFGLFLVPPLPRGLVEVGGGLEFSYQPGDGRRPAWVDFQAWNVSGSYGMVSGNVKIDGILWKKLNSPELTLRIGSKFGVSMGPRTQIFISFNYNGKTLSGVTLDPRSQTVTARYRATVGSRLTTTITKCYNPEGCKK